MSELEQLTDGEKDTVLYLHDSLLEIVHRSGMAPDIATAVVMMLSALFCAQSPMNDKQIIEEFTRVLKLARIRIAVKQKERKTEQ